MPSAPGMITAAAWVPRGFAAPFPQKYALDEAEYERIEALARLQLEDAREDLEEAEGASGPKTKKKKDKNKSKEAEDLEEAPGQEQEQIDINDDDLKEYDLEHYDDDAKDDDGSDAGDGDLGAAMGQPLAMFGNLRSLTYYASNKEDPYITLPKTAAAADEEDEDEDDEEDREELQVLATDNLLLAARVEDELAHLEVYVYEDEADNLYVHHDIMLPAIPLCVEWLDAPVSSADGGWGPDQHGNFVAVGTMDPDIEIWDLDTVDRMYPNAILGAGGMAVEELAAEEKKSGKKSSKKSKKSKKPKTKTPNPTHHVDAVLALSLNRSHRHLLASASADATVKLWDLRRAGTSGGGAATASFSHHGDKACAVAWHPSPSQATVLLTGSYDGTVAALDVRTAAADPGSVRRWAADADVEGIMWDPHAEHRFYVASEKGTLACHDVRAAGGGKDGAATTKPLWTLQAHDAPLSTFDVNAHVPGLVATGSADRTVKLWNVGDGGGGPTLVASGKDLDVGKVFAAAFAPDAEVAFRLAVAGTKGQPRVWDTSTNRAVRRVFASRLRGRDATEDGRAADRMVAVQSEGESSDDDEGDERAGGASLRPGAGGGKPKRKKAARAEAEVGEDEWMDED